MSNYIYVGVDNGVTGSLFIIKENNSCYFFKIPTKKELSYTQKKQHITRIDSEELNKILDNFLTENSENIKVFIERPMINPMRWKASISAARCLEAVLISFERRNFSVSYLDSRKWQKQFLPKDIKKEDLKKASSDIATRLFPKFKEHIKAQKDGDSILIAEYARRNNL